MGLLAFPMGFSFLAGLAIILRGDDPTATWLTIVVVVSFTATLCVAAVQGIFTLAPPYVAGSASGADLKLLADLYTARLQRDVSLDISYFVATGVLTLRTRALPAWLGYGTSVVVVAALLASLGVVVQSGPLAAGGPVTLVALVSGLLWWLVASFLLLIRRSSPVA